MKVLHIVSDFGQGGTQTYVCGLLEEQIGRNELKVDVIALFFRGALWDRARATGAGLDCVEMRNALDGLGLLRFFRRLRAGNYDIVHVHAIHPLVSLLLRWSGAYCIYHEHGGGLLAGEVLPRLIYTVFERSYDGFIAISAFMKGYVEAINPRLGDRLHLVYNGVDMKSIEMIEKIPYAALPSSWPEDALVVGTVGRLVPLKRVDVFISVAAELAKRFENVVFPIVGDGPVRRELEAQASRLGIQRSVLFLGYRPDAVSIMKRFDVLLFTSEFEAFGLVIAEAMAASVPVVAISGKRTAVEEIIDDEVDGIVVGEADVQQLAEKITMLIEQPGLRDAINRNSREKVRTCFSMKSNVERLSELYRCGAVGLRGSPDR